MDPMFKRGELVTVPGKTEIYTIVEVMHGHPDANPMYSIKYGNESRWAREDELESFVKGSQ